jgi:preprotein translocase subunit SecY
MIEALRKMEYWIIAPVKNIYRGVTRCPQLRKELLVTLALLLLIRLGCYIPLPYIDLEGHTRIFEQHALFQLFNLFYGGGLRYFSFFALGVFPIAYASVTFSLLVMIIPPLSKRYREYAHMKSSLGNSHKESPAQKMFVRIQTYSLLGLTVLFAFLLGWPLIQSAQTVGIMQAGTTPMLIGICLVVTGAVVVFWLNVQMKQHGIGMGRSLIVVMGVFGEASHKVIDTLSSSPFSTMASVRLGFALILFAGYLMMLILFRQGTRKIPVQYAKRVVGKRVYGGQRTHIPLRILPDGIKLIINAIELLLTISLLLSLFQPNGIWQTTGLASQILGNDRIVYPIIVLLLKLWSILRRKSIDSYELAENMKRYGGFIPGVHPGKQTAQYIDAIATRLLIGSIGCLLILLTFPGVMVRLTGFRIGLHGFLMFLGVPVIIQILQRIEAVLLEEHYEGFMKREKLRGRKDISNEHHLQEETRREDSGIEPHKRQKIEACLQQYTRDLKTTNIGAIASSFLPPLDVQIRVVASLGKAFDKLGNVVEQQLGRQFQSTLKSEVFETIVFSGGITYDLSTLQVNGDTATIKSVVTRESDQRGHGKKVILFLVNTKSRWFIFPMKGYPHSSKLIRVDGRWYPTQIKNDPLHDKPTRKTLKTLVDVIQEYTASIKAFTQDIQKHKIDQKEFKARLYAIQKPFHREIKKLERALRKGKASKDKDRKKA